MAPPIPSPKELAQIPVDWVEERSGLIGVGKYLLFRNVPKDISWLRNFAASNHADRSTRTIRSVLLISAPLT